MAGSITENRIIAERLWKASQGKRLITDIAKELGVHRETVSRWKRLDKWTLEPKPEPKKKDGRGAPKGNKNAVGNKGGKGSRGLKNNLSTHEHESILMHTLTDDERKLVKHIHLDKIVVLREELMLLTIRERRMMQRIADLSAATKGLSVTKLIEIKSQGYENGSVVEKKSNESHIQPVIETIIRVEEALTRVQARKQMVVDQLHKIEVDQQRYELELKRIELEMLRIEMSNIVPNADDGADDGFIMALEAKVTEVWDDEPDSD